MNRSSRFLLSAIISLLLLALITVAISLFNLDLKIESYFYDPSASGWYQRDYTPWALAYDYGPYPAIFIFVLALFLFFLSLKISKLAPVRRNAQFIILSFILGPGLLVNGVFKDHWGRPRPRQIEQFGGTWTFHEVWQPGIPGKGNSFPSGHASTGFFLIVFYFIYRKKNLRLARIALAVSIAAGFYIGAARMAQGGHFLSDVFWAGGMTCGAAALIDFLMRRFSARPCPEWTRKKPVLKWATIVAAAGLLTYFFAFSKPVYREYDHHARQSDSAIPILLTMQQDAGEPLFSPGQYEFPIEIRTTLRGFGFPVHDLKSQLMEEMQRDTLRITYRLDIDGIFQKMDVVTEVYFDSSYTILLQSGSIAPFDHSEAAPASVLQR